MTFAQFCSKKEAYELSKGMSLFLFIVTSLKGVGTPREAPKNVFWDVSVFSSDSGREMIAFASSMH